MERRSSPSASPTARQSRTNGFLFADLRDYTRFVESRGDRAAAALLDRYRVLVRAAVAQFDGAEIKTEGDSFYVVFPSVGAAVECGLAILAAAAEPSGDDAPIRVGIGVHAGETVETEEGYVGAAVNVAARICGQARAGELLVSDTVRALTRTNLPVRFTDRRTRRLKGIAEPVVLYRALPSGERSEGAVGAGRRPAARLPTPSAMPVARVVVLLAGLLIGGAASGYLLIAAQGPGAPATQPPSQGAPAQGPFPDQEEGDLLIQLPSNLRDTCVRENTGNAAPGATASLQCDLALAAEADTVWYDRLPSGQALQNVIGQIVQRERLRFGDCGPDLAHAQGNWRVGSTHSGRLLCYQADGHSWIVWTYEADRILARAVRAGDRPDDWLGLFGWWDQIRLFVR